jgi:type 1 glutamine amidotransferase
MRLLWITTALLGCALVAGLAPAQQNAPRKKRILAIGETKGYQHDSVTRGLAMMWQLGRDTGLWDTFIKTDTQLVTKKKLEGNAKNLDYFDAIYMFTTGELPMDDQQKADLLSFVHEDGKGIIGGHTSIDTFYKWPEYGEMMGAYFDNHPWNTFDAPVIVEDRTSPITSYFQPAFLIHDEIYQPSSIFSREKLHVLMRLDESKLDLNHKGVKRTDKDFAVAWVKNYGKGRVFYTTIGHTLESYERPDVQKMYLEAAKWCLRLTDTDTTPHPKPAQ